ncbi:MAG: hypothetical protein LC792_23340 [Actinobacteria bacterium]|nr:hypothetical protein [Actinomycetota bacterium]
MNAVWVWAITRFSSLRVSGINRQRPVRVHAAAAADPGQVEAVQLEVHSAIAGRKPAIGVRPILSFTPSSA